LCVLLSMLNSSASSHNGSSHSLPYHNIITVHTSTMALKQRQRRTLWGSSIILSQIFLAILSLSPESCNAFSSRTTSSSVSTIRSNSRPREVTALSIFRKEDATQDDQTTPYIIERINRKPNDDIFRDIAEMCIDVFFKEPLNAKPEDKIA
jgi:hypothetical protein